MKWYHPLTALVLLSRIAIPTKPEWYTGAQSDRWAYPLAGFFIALPLCIIAIVLDIFQASWVMIAMILTIGPTIATGALHEDGLSDCADGFWGAATQQKRLAIMKDSRLGTYGTLSLIVVLLLTFANWFTLLSEDHRWWTVFIVLQMLSRAAMLIPMTFLPPARKDGLAVHVGQSSLWDVLVAFFISTGIAIVLMGINGLGLSIIAAACGFAVQTVAQRKIGGHTGDVLGATQQVTAAILLLIFAS